MNPFPTVLAFSAIPASGNFLCRLLAEAAPKSQRILSLALHSAAGIVVEGAGIELRPEALAAEQSWRPSLAFAAAGGLSLLMVSGGYLERFNILNAPKPTRQNTAAPTRRSGIFEPVTNTRTPATITPIFTSTSFEVKI